MINVKLYLVIALLIGALIWIGDMWYQEHKALKILEASKQEVAKQILTSAREINRVVKANGTEAVLLDITGNHTLSKHSGKTDMPDIVDTAALALDIRTRQLKELTVIAAQFKAENLQLKAQLDSSQRIYYTYNGNGLQLKFTPPYDSLRSASADFVGTFGVTVAQGYQKKWLFGKEKTLMSVTSDSPYFKISNVNYVGFDKSPPLVQLNGKWKAAYNVLAGSSTGLGIQVKLGRFSLEGDYQYYLDSKKWGWGAATEFTIGKL